MQLAALLSPLLRRPCCCLALLWTAGVILGLQYAVPPLAWFAVFPLFLLSWLLTRTRAELVARLALSCAVVALAAGWAAWRTQPPSPLSTAFLPTATVIVQGYPLTPAIVTGRQWHTTFRLRARCTNGVWYAAGGDVYLQGDGRPPALGQYQRVLGWVSPAEGAGNPVDFSWRSYLAARGLTYRLRVREMQGLTADAPVPWASGLRAYCSARLAATMPGSYGALHAQVLESLVLGIYGSPLPDELTEDFRRAGILHLMVVSGSQVVLFGLLFLLPLRLLPSGHARTSYPRLRRALLLLSLPLLCLYMALADSGPSLNRAVWMVLFTALALWLALSRLAEQRSFRPDPLTLLAAAGLILLIAQPAALFSPGLQLSFAAVFGLWTITPILLRLWAHWPACVSLPLAATLGAQWMTNPILVWHFGVISLLAPLTNLLAAPLVALLLPLGLLAVCCAITVPWLAIGVNYLNLPLLQALLWVSEMGAKYSWSQLTLYTRSPWAVLLYYAILWLLLRRLAIWVNSRTPGWNIPAGREPRLW
ncbi:MAG TPA: ComEC/Rec2 family competence protein [Armatimonadota bacterium]|jgi:competence protein ComEC